MQRWFNVYWSHYQKLPTSLFFLLAELKPSQIWARNSLYNWLLQNKIKLNHHLFFATWTNDQPLPNMKKLLLAAAACMFLVLTSCTIDNPSINTNVAGEAAGLYRGTLILPNGDVLTEEEIEMHRVSDDHISVESMNEDNQRADIFQDFNMQLMRSGAVIHHQLGTESNGTFVLDAAVTPDELRIDLPTGLHFSGTRVRNYFE